MAGEEKMLQQVVELCRTKDTFAAIAHVEAHGEPRDVAKVYAQLVIDLYGQQKDVPNMLRLGGAGVHYCLTEAERAADADAAGELRGMAKMMSFNLSANCWPGWEDEGITLTAGQIAQGHDFAKVNLRLANELGRSADKVASAWWLLGAHQLAAKDNAQAIASFDKAASLSTEARQEDGRLMAEGYRGIAMQASAETEAEGTKELTTAIAALRNLNTDDATFYADQLESVAKFFAK